MRLDKYLKVSRLIKRRTVANEACDNGLVTVNGKPARASYEVKVGDEISLRFGARTLTVEVLAVEENVRQADAAALYRAMERLGQCIAQQRLWCSQRRSTYLNMNTALAEQLRAAQEAVDTADFAAFDDMIAELQRLEAELKKPDPQL